MSCLAAAIALAAVASGCGGNDAPDPDTGIDAPGPVGPSEITIRTFPERFPYLGRTENAALVAFQDGDGAWQALTGSGGVYHATATGLRYSVAVACPNEGLANVGLYYQAVSDTKEVRADGCVPLTGYVKLSVDVAGLGAGERAQVWVGRDVAFSSAGELSELFALKGVTDVFVKSETDTFPAVPIKLYRGPSLDIQADQTLRYDINALGQPPEPHGLTIMGIDPAESVGVNSSYATPHSSIQWPVRSSGLKPTPDNTYVTVAAAMRQPTDVSNVTVNASRSTSDGRTYVRTVRRAMNPPVDVTVALPAAYAAEPPTVDATALRRATVTIPISPSTLGTADYTVSLATSGTFETPERRWSLFVRSGWAGDEASVTITTPDLSGFPGWSADFALHPGAVRWSIARGDHNLAFDALPVDGRHIVASRVEGELLTP